jgi:hypothetical protein
MDGYDIFICIDDGETKTWWSVDHYDSLEEAEQHVELMCEGEYNRTGNWPKRLDDDEAH